MKVNIIAVNEFIKKNYRNNKTWFAEVIGINTSYLNQILNGKVSASSFKMCNAIVEYCRENNLDFNEFISL